MKFIRRYRELRYTYTIKEMCMRSLSKVYEYIYHKIRKFFISIKPVDINTGRFLGFIPDICFLYDIERKKEYVESMIALGKCRNILGQADNICDHRFDLLGSGEVYLGESINWSCDFKSEFVWPKEYFKNLKIIDFSNNADVKVPWELSRFQHVFTLGKAYWLTDDEKYSREFRNQIEHWIDGNPIEMTVNWACTMDVAIRAVNWITGYYFFQESEIMDENFRGIFNKTLYLHGRFVFNNLEDKLKYTGNHYLTNLAGLIWLGLYFRGHNIGLGQNCPDTWLDYGLKEFEKEMAVQVNEDGTSYEASTSYHRLVTEIFLITTILCNKNNIWFCQKYMERFEKMCDFIADITKPDGTAPIIGDADDGRFIIFSDYPQWERRDFRHILAVAGEYLDRDDFRYQGRKDAEDALWAGGFCMGEIKTAESPAAPPLNSAAYSNGGYYILRNSRVYCIIRCGELSLRGRGGHSHNDQLSMELNIDGEDILIDPGTYVYTADYRMRNIFRSTAVHNTVYIDGIEQNDFGKYSMFLMREQTFGECVGFTDTQFIGRHYGYKDKLGVVHERIVDLKSDGIVITDIITGEKGEPPNAHTSFVLNIDCEVNKREKDILLKCRNAEIILAGEGAQDAEINDVFIASSYGRLDRSIRLDMPISNKYNTIEIRTVCCKNFTG